MPARDLARPFVGRGEVTNELIRTIRDVLAPVASFEFAPSSVGQFEDGTTYLAPVPAQPFVQLTEMLFAAFPEWPPYGGAFSGVVPHATIGRGLEEREVTAMRRCLPLIAQAAEVTLTWWSEHEAEDLVRIPLHPKPSPIAAAPIRT